MRTVWKVKEIHATETQTLATLVRGMWYKRTPGYDAWLADDTRTDDMDEFMDLDGPEVGAEWVEFGEKPLVVDIVEFGLGDVGPGDAVVVTFDALERVSV